MKKRFIIYTDGSHLDKLNNGRLGCAGILIDPTKTTPENQFVSSYSQELNPVYMKFRYGTSQCSNPTAEMMGVYCALIHFKKELRNAKSITIKADYNGVKNWMEGTWEIKEPYIRKIKADINEEINRQGLLVYFDWVKGHQDNHDFKTNPDGYWNDKVDEFAKGLEDEK